MVVKQNFKEVAISCNQKIINFNTLNFFVAQQKVGGSIGRKKAEYYLAEVKMSLKVITFDG